jgi:hypothetical protein
MVKDNKWIPGSTKGYFRPNWIKADAQMMQYDVGEVDVKIDQSHVNKLRVLQMTMQNWAYAHNRLRYPGSEKKTRLFEADMEKVTDLLEQGRKLDEIRDQKEFLTKDEMLYLNKLFKSYK